MLLPHLPSDTSSVVMPVGCVTKRPLAWLWPGRLALGKLAILDGDPGLGKSLLTLDLCARLSTGRPMPDGTAAGGVVNSLVLNAEDAVADTVLPRLHALGADPERVFVLRDRDAPPLRLPAQLDVLEAALDQTGARLVVLDPAVAFLEVNTANDASVRQGLQPLAQLAERRACVVLLVRHLNKRAGRRALYRGGGSIGLVGACRSAWLVGRDPQDAGRCALAEVKNNLGPPQPSLGYAVAPRADGPPALTWLGPTALTADELLGAVPSVPECPRDRARAFLAAALAGGPRRSREVWEEAQRQGFTERTLRRAKKELSVQSRQVWEDGVQRRYLLLPEQRLPSALLSEAENSLEELLAPLREKYPPRTPLDDEDER